MKHFCDQCKVHPAEKLHFLIELTIVPRFQWGWNGSEHAQLGVTPFFDVNTPLITCISMVYSMALAMQGIVTPL